MKLLRRTSFADYLEGSRPRLEALEKLESKPKVIPRIFEFWARDHIDDLYGAFPQGDESGWQDAAAPSRRGGAAEVFAF